MVKKVKRFVVFVLFAFFHSMLMGKTAEADNVAESTACVFPKSGVKLLRYNGVETEKDLDVLAHEIEGCY